MSLKCIQLYPDFILILHIFVFDCLQENVCNPFQNYFQRMDPSQNVRNNNLAVKVPRMKTEFGRKSFRVTAANVYNNSDFNKTVRF